MITDAVVTLPTDDSEDLPLMQVEYLGVTDNATRVVPYPCFSNPTADMAVFLGMMDDHVEDLEGIAHAPYDRKKVKPGEGGIQNIVANSFIYMKNDGTIETVSKDIVEKIANAILTEFVTMTLKGTTVNIMADLNVIGNTNFTGQVRANGKVIDDTHGHDQPNDSAGNSESQINGVI